MRRELVASCLVCLLIVASSAASAQSPTTVDFVSRATPDGARAPQADTRVRLESDERGLMVRQPRGPGAPRVLCTLPCEVRVPARNPSLALLRAGGGVAFFPQGMTLGARDVLGVRYVSRWRERVAGGVLLGAVVVGVTALVAVLAANRFDFSLGDHGPEGGAAGLVYGAGLGLLLAGPLALLVTPDRAESARRNR